MQAVDIIQIFIHASGRNYHIIFVFSPVGENDGLSGRDYV